MTDGNARGDGKGRGDIEALRAEIRRTRAELSETAQALAARADVKARLRGSAVRSGRRVRQRVGRAAEGVAGPVRGAASMVRRRPVPWTVVSAGVVAAVVVLVLVRGRHR